MADGVDRRSQIDTETVKALLFINGGGSVAMLSLVPSLIEKERFAPLVHAVLVGLVILVLGLAAAVIHNRLRRKCSLHYESYKMSPPKGRILGIQLWEPTVCCASTALMWLSIVAFVVAALYVAWIGIQIV